VSLIAGAFSAHAAGLGKLTVYSAIGQPLNAEIALTATADELTSLSAKLASHEAFKERGIEFMSALSGLRMSVIKLTNGQPVLRLNTDQALNEPFMHFLVELNWTAGRVMREYTFLLDPPEMVKPQTAASTVSPVVPPVTPTAPEALPPSQPSVTEMKSAPEVKPPAVAVPAQTGKRAEKSDEVIEVKPGDTLSKIARAHMPESVTLDQMLVALFNANRGVFTGDNMNRLRAGKILRLPDPASVAGVDTREARRMIITQASDFNAYKRRLAEAAATAPAESAPAGQEASGKIKPQVEQKAPAAPAADKLVVSPTESAKSAKADAAKAKLEEDLVARDKALREASERIAQLEKNLDNLKKLAELKSQAGAELQQQAQAQKPVEPKPAPETPRTEPAKSESAKSEPVITAAPAAPVEKPAVAEVAPPPPKPAAKKPAPPPPPPPELSFVEENPELVFGGGSLIALLLGYLGYGAWRRKKKAASEAAVEPASPAFVPQQAAAVAATAAAEPLEDAPSILGDFSESGSFTAMESVDPVAEADVLMAYGRDGQAEEILIEGLKNEPTRTAIHAKLLEIYANRKDTVSFESVALQLYTLSNGEGPEWEKANRIAGELGLNEGLFASAAPAASAAYEDADIAVADSAAVEPSSADVGAMEPLAGDSAGAIDFEPAAVMPEPVSAEEADSGSLDFDLDLGTTSVSANQPPAAVVTEADASPVADEVMSLDFDFDLGSPTEGKPLAEASEAVAVLPDVSIGESAVESNLIDFAIDEPLVSAEAAVAGIPESPAPVADNEIDFDLDIAGEEAPAAASVDAVAMMPAETELPAPPMPLDLADISLDLGEPEPAEPARQPELVGDASIDLDLEMNALESNPDLAVAVDADPDLEQRIDLDLDELTAPRANEIAGEVDDPEVATKLELAQAYEEMGDREGARELLTEVLNEGSTSQREMAKSRLDQLENA